MLSKTRSSSARNDVGRALNEDWNDVIQLFRMAAKEKRSEAQFKD